MAMKVADLQDHGCYPREYTPQFKDGITDRENIDLQGGSSGIWELNRLHNSSRIVRVSRSSGGKDRHSKVWTARGLRDRRIRLSLNTAIQFYDLQDRLGYDQPSKAVEWLIKAAADPISELPSLKSYFSAPHRRAIPPETSENQLDLAGFQLNNDDSDLNKPIPNCDTVSDAKIGSGCHVFPSKLANKANDAAFSTEKGGGKEVESRILSRGGGNVSFTELLTNGMMTSNSKEKQWSTMAVDYFGFGSFGDGNSALPCYSISTGHLLSVPSKNCNNYNLNFTISPSFQPNLSSMLPQLQSMPYSDSSSNSFLFGDDASVQTHQLLSFDSRLQLCNCESRDCGQKETMKN